LEINQTTRTKDNRKAIGLYSISENKQVVRKKREENYRKQEKNAKQSEGTKNQDKVKIRTIHEKVKENLII